MNILQIGAFRGSDHVLEVCLRHKERLNKVVLVEPQPKAMEAVRRAYRDVPNCEFVEAAVTDRPEDTAQLWLPGSADDAPFALASLRAENIALRGRKVEACLEVPALRITELQAMFEGPGDIPTIHQVHLDAELMTGRILLDMDFEHYIVPYIVYEFPRADSPVLEFALPDLIRAERRLLEEGYTIRQSDRGNRIAEWLEL